MRAFLFPFHLSFVRHDEWLFEILIRGQVHHVEILWRLVLQAATRMYVLWLLRFTKATGVPSQYPTQREHVSTVVNFLQGRKEKGVIIETAKRRRKRRGEKRRREKKERKRKKKEEIFENVNIKIVSMRGTRTVSRIRVVGEGHMCRCACVRKRGFMRRRRQFMLRGQWWWHWSRWGVHFDLVHCEFGTFPNFRKFDGESGTSLAIRGCHKFDRVREKEEMKRKGSVNRSITSSTVSFFLQRSIRINSTKVR